MNLTGMEVLEDVAIVVGEDHPRTTLLGAVLGPGLVLVITDAVNSELITDFNEAVHDNFGRQRKPSVLYSFHLS